MIGIFSNIGSDKGKQGLKNSEGKLSSTWNSIPSQEGRNSIFRYNRFIGGVCVSLQVIENQEKNGLKIRESFLSLDKKSRCR